nr:MAG TPA: Protein of unknown function (DUF2185) [Caudoviricetes sp.]
MIFREITHHPEQSGWCFFCNLTYKNCTVILFRWARGGQKYEPY